MLSIIKKNTCERSYSTSNGVYPITSNWVIIAFGNMFDRTERGFKKNKNEN